MNPFQAVLSRIGSDGSYIGASALPQYFKEEIFGHQLQRFSANNLEDGLSILLSMLKHVALDPRHSNQLSAEGVVMLMFFWHSNPIRSIDLPADHPRRQEIEEAIKANKESSMFKAATRVLKWRSRARLERHHRSSKVIYARLLESELKIEPSLYKTDPSQAYGLEAQRRDRVISKWLRIKDRRKARLALFELAITSRPMSWYELLVVIAQDILPEPLLAA